MASGRLIDYLGQGVLADRPASLDLITGGLGLWLATDTGELSGWDGSNWIDLGSGFIFIEPTGGFTHGAMLVYDADAGAWIELAPRNPGDVLTLDASNLPDWEAPPSAPVDSVNGETGNVVLGVGSLSDVIEPSGGWSHGTLLMYDGGAGAWVEIQRGDPGDVLTEDASVGPNWQPPTTGAVDSVNGQTGVVITTPLTDAPAFSATPTIDTSDKDVIYFGALTANVTAFNLSGTRAKVIVAFKQDGTGGWTVAAGSSIDFGADIPNLSGVASAANAYTYVGFVYHPTTAKFRVVAISK